jgi:hypothetical protein
MPPKELSYQIYSEFKDSDWYIYWDKEYARVKKHQLLVVWYAKSDAYAYFDYMNLVALMEKGDVLSALPYTKNLPPEQTNYVLSIFNEWISDMDEVFKDKKDESRKNQKG